MATPENAADNLLNASKPSRLLEAVRDTIRFKHYSLRTEETYVHWIRRCIHFQGERHPRELGAREVTAFLNHLVKNRDVAAATQKQALSAPAPGTGERSGFVDLTEELCPDSRVRHASQAAISIGFR